MSDEIKLLFKELNERPIAYYAVYARITGGIKSGILLSQCMYWWYAMKEEAFYKSEGEWLRELAMNRKEFRNAKKMLEALSFIEVEVSGSPKKTYYFIDTEKVQNVVLQSAETAQLKVPKGNNAKCRNGTIKSAERELSTYTENTTENTTEKGVAVPATDVELKQLIFMFKDINHLNITWYQNKTQREALKRLVKKFGYEKIFNLVEELPGIIEKPYAPKITTPVELEKSLAKLILFVKQEKSKINKNGISRL